MVADCRRDFPMLRQTMHGQPLLYLDSGATAHKPQQVIDAESMFYAEHYGTVHRAVYSLANQATERYQRVRARVAQFLNAPSPDTIIFTRGTTDALNLVAHSYGKSQIIPGDEILVCETEHHANLVPWQMIAQERGAKVIPIPVDDSSAIDMKAFERLLSPRTAIVAVAHIANVTGTCHPVSEICRLAHASGAVVVVDGAQAAPHQHVDVEALGADFYTFSGHKLYGPTGVGVLYGRTNLLESMPPIAGGGDMIDTVSFAGTTYASPPARFEAGTPMIAQVMALETAIDYVEQVGLDTIAQHEQKLLEQATDRLNAIDGLRIIGTAPNKAAIISFVIDGCHPFDLGTMLDLRGICIRTGHHCSQTTMQRFGVESTARISFGLYNIEEEVEQFVSHLHQVLEILR